MDQNLLKGKKALIVGVANDNSIAYGCAKMLKKAGADLAITYLNEKAKPFVDKVAEELKPSIYMPCDVTSTSDVSNVFNEIQEQWHEMDILIHSIAFAPKKDLQGPVVECSKEGFLLAMEISCYSFIQMANLAKPLMKNGGTLFAMSFHGAQQVIEHYNVMGPVKSALESAVRYMAFELGPQKIRVIAISPGPVKTRAASGLEEFDKLLQRAEQESPLKSVVDIVDVGAMVTYLSSDYAKHITGDTIYIDAGFHLLG